MIEETFGFNAMTLLVSKVFISSLNFPNAFLFVVSFIYVLTESDKAGVLPILLDQLMQIMVLTALDHIEVQLSWTFLWVAPS